MLIFAVLLTISFILLAIQGRLHLEIMLSHAGGTVHVGEYFGCEAAEMRAVIATLNFNLRKM
jgi:hypothetical protein